MCWMGRTQVVRRFLLRFERDANQHGQRSLFVWSAKKAWTNFPQQQEEILQQSTEDAVSRANSSCHGNTGSLTDFQTFQLRMEKAKIYIPVIVSFQVEMWWHSPAPFMASLSFWTSASGLKPAASVTVPRVPIWTETNHQIWVLLRFSTFHAWIFELYHAEW